MDEYNFPDKNELDYLEFIKEMKYTEDLFNALKKGDLNFLKKFFLLEANEYRFDLSNHKTLTEYMLYAEENSQFEVVHFLIGKGAFEHKITSDRCKKYLSFISGQMKIKRALKKIQHWWIPICYDVNHFKCTSGKRIFERNWQRVQDDIKNLQVTIQHCY